MLPRERNRNLLTDRQTDSEYLAFQCRTVAGLVRVGQFPDAPFSPVLTNNFVFLSPSNKSIFNEFLIMMR